jgi:hypothetical protein
MRQLASQREQTAAALGARACRHLLEALLQQLTLLVRQQQMTL